MKKFTHILLFCFLALGIRSQQLPTAQSEISMDANLYPAHYSSDNTQARTQNAIIWSEDFSGGLPSTWTNLGLNPAGGLYPNAVWEYRGPLTSPTSAMGSRGGFGAPGTPINSPTRANGFMIFDSDYLDNGGVQGAFGQGSAPAPHTGRLTTGTIDLSGHQHVKLEFHYFARKFTGRFSVAISINNGQNYNDTVYFGTSLGVNESSPTNAKAEFDISSIAGGQAQVKLRFIFDGTIANGNNYGYYFCMIDDIKITELPAHQLVPFTDDDGITFDVWNDDRTEKRHGYVSERQSRGYKFGANVYNFGGADQNNARLEVDIYQNNTFVQTVMSNPAGILASGDSLTVAQTATNTFVPTQSGVYTAAYRIVSDSIPPADAQVDTLVFVVHENQIGQHFPYSSNTIGSPQLSETGAVSSQFEIINREVAFGAIAGIANNTTAGGQIIFKLTQNTPQSTLPPLATDTVTITAAHISAGIVVANFGPTPPVLNAGNYYIIAEMNAGTSTINFMNDARVWAPPLANLMYLVGTQTGWFTGYANSRQFNVPHLRLIGCGDTTGGPCDNIAALKPFPPMCATDPAITLSGGSPAGGNYSGPGVSAGQFDPSIPGAGNHTITYSVSINSSLQTATQDIEVMPSPTIFLPPTTPKICGGLPLVNLNSYVNPGGGTFTGPGVSATSSFNPSVAGLGTHTLTYTFEDPIGCESTETFQVEVVASPTPTFNMPVTNFCVYSDTVVLAASPSGGLFSGPGVFGNQFVPAQAGVGNHPIIYTYTDGNDCDGTEMVMVAVDSCLSVDQFQLKDFIHVYPNPSSGVFTLRHQMINNTSDVAIIYNAQGMLIGSYNLRNQETEIDMERQPSGIYFLRLQNHPELGSMRLIIH
ncbi:MAG: T9SS type A sorting domain-containing protein [Cryomorphaceae bacterium]|nr:T9SS type A sorting domain-containing protein [Cryomorphaceae bacterium]